MMICAFLRPMNAMKSPMPTASACIMLTLIAAMIFSRTPTMDITKKTTPARNTAPSAARHGSAAPAEAATGMAVKTKKKF